MQVPTRRQAGAVLAALALAALCGCSRGGGDEGSSVSRQELPLLVLQPGDLTQTWIRFDEGPLLRADQPAGERVDPARFGRVDGWKARYRRSGGPGTRGPLVVESRVDLFEEDDGAQEEFEAAARDLDSRFDGPAEGAPAIGDESHAVTSGTPAAGTARTFAVVWREGTVVALVVGQGFQGRYEVGDVVELARKQQERIERAAAG